MNDRRLIEDYLPIEAISAEAPREKSVGKGHISRLHSWWARRPLVACRAAVYGALVPADRWVKEVELRDPPADPEKAERVRNGKKKGLNRKAAKEFVTKLCRYPKSNPTNPEDIRTKRETEAAIAEAQRHILEAHAERLTAELHEGLRTGRMPAWVDEFQFPVGPPCRAAPVGPPCRGGQNQGPPCRGGQEHPSNQPPPPSSVPLNSRGESVPLGSHEASVPLGSRDLPVVTWEDIVAGRAPRPRVLDMFAGGGAIPLEALRLGCEAYALDLNPVAHIIELCTLVYPQKYGKPDPTVPGMTGPKNAKGETTWGGLAEEVRYWGNWVLDRVRREIGDLYPPIPDPEVWAEPPEIAFDRQTGQWNATRQGRLKRGVRLEQPTVPASLLPDEGDDEEDDDEANGGTASGSPALPPGFLQPVAYLWTRTVRCKNPGCGATVPLVRQTWMCKKKGRYVALRMIAPKGAKRVRFEVVESDTEKGLGFDPAGFSKAGNATCPFCGTVADNDYVKSEGRAGRMGKQPMAVVCTRPGRKGKVYLAADSLPPARLGEGRTEGSCLPDDEAIRRRIAELCQRTGLTVPDEPITTDAKNSCWTHLYGLTTFGHLFTPRQMLCLLSFAAAVRAVLEACGARVESERAKAVGTYFAILVNRMTDYNCCGTTWEPSAEFIGHYFTRQAIPMVWDFAELAAFGDSSGSPKHALDWIVGVINSAYEMQGHAVLMRGSATSLPWSGGTGGSPVQFDAVITDPPYYDNVPYADISDFFYVWLKRTIGHIYPEHFATAGTPKKQEAVADATRHGGDKQKAVRAYEQMMALSLAEAHRVLKPGGTLAVVYAHKTTLGWSTLVDALRRAGFTVTEAWPLDTEMKSRLRGMDSAALASSIFLVGRKREASAGVGNYETDVQPELEAIVRERVETLWEMGITGADLVIACVGAGLRAFTKYERVEYANGEEVPAEKFLAEVEGVVLDTMMGKLLAASCPHPETVAKGRGPSPPAPLPQAGEGRAVVSAVDPPSRFYVLWRFIYKASEIDAGEAIVFTYAQHVELDGPLGLSTGKDALVEKKKAKYRARDFTERGDKPKLGLPNDNGQPAPLIDVLHRVLWLLENSPRKLGEFLDEARPDRERLRVLAQALAGAALSGKREEDAEKLISTTAPEQAALQKLLANWRSLIEGAMVTKQELADRKAGQKFLDLK